MDGPVEWDLLETPVGKVGLALRDGSVVRCDTGTDERRFRRALSDAFRRARLQRGGTLIDQASSQVQEYLTGTRTSFDIPVAPEGGTPFQRSVWAALRTIPYGQTRSYRWVAAAVGNPRAARAVGQASGANPIGIIVPCHRVVRADGSLGGFSGGVGVKDRLLTLERSNTATKDQGG